MQTVTEELTTALLPQQSTNIKERPIKGNRLRVTFELYDRLSHLGGVQRVVRERSTVAASSI